MAHLMLSQTSFEYMEDSKENGMKVQGEKCELTTYRLYAVYIYFLQNVRSSSQNHGTVCSGESNVSL